ncbi:hypothetical protein IV203_037249 [Nitzschia inconspicua]|uniref:Uncharacterized protein n=1 Tax=Nitzschia inconspicua TaxID=303405 RepID=A0A9K3PY21_9STRA|nr:hypothetical protein IV203_006571 [Nitzschia inconspicua]KAG7364047.1 hypothetical protein IV203_037249 [Nitzschia inconspicua]
MYSRKVRPRGWINAGLSPALIKEGTKTARRKRPVPKQSESTRKSSSSIEDDEGSQCVVLDGVDMIDPQVTPIRSKRCKPHSGGAPDENEGIDRAAMFRMISLSCQDD